MTQGTLEVDRRQFIRYKSLNPPRLGRGRRSAMPGEFLCTPAEVLANIDGPNGTVEMMLAHEQIGAALRQLTLEVLQPMARKHRLEIRPLPRDEEAYDVERAWFGWLIRRQMFDGFVCAFYEATTLRDDDLFLGLRLYDVNKGADHTRILAMHRPHNGKRRWQLNLDILDLHGPHRAWVDEFADVAEGTADVHDVARRMLRKAFNLPEDDE